MDFTLAGSREAVIKFVKICLWVGFSAIVTFVATQVSEWKPTTSEWIIVQGLLNAVMPSFVEWVKTKK